MKVTAPAGVVVGVVIAVVIFLSLFAIIPMLLFGSLKSKLGRDDANLLSIRMMQLHQRIAAPTPAEIDAEIAQMIRSGVVGGSIAPDGKPLDRWGTPYKVTHLVDKLVHWAIVTGAGPDRTFDTPDDAQAGASWESHPLKQR